MRTPIQYMVLVVMLAALATAAAGQSPGPWPERLDLSLLDGEYGFTIRGFAEDDFAGAAVAMLGDANGDGVDDYAVSAPGLSDNAGSVVVLYGRTRSAPFPATIDLSALTPDQGFRLDGELRNHRFGGALAAAGDVNGDGLADLLIGAAGARDGAGNAYVIFGQRDPVPLRRSITELGLGEVVRLRGRVFERIGDQAGASVAGVGDFNGDARDDVAIGAPGADQNTGLVFVIFGHGGVWPLDAELRDAVVDGGIELAASNSGWFGGSLSTGDANGDGLGDLLIGAPNDSPGGRDDAGSAYLLYGSHGWGGHVRLPILDPTQGTRFDGLFEDGHAGRAVAILGDINGDGRADVAVNRPRTSDGSDARVTVRFGAGWPAPFLAIEPLWGTHEGIGFDVVPASGRLSQGNVVAGADVDGDGVNDLICGIPDIAYLGDPLYSGRVYIFFGGHARGRTVRPRETREGVAYLVGPAIESYAGVALAAGGDVNGDGIADLLIGAPTRRGDTAGGAFVVFGRRGQPCRADFDGDGALTLLDFLLFQDVFQAGDRRADFDGDGDLTIFDFLVYLALFGAGCR